MKENKNNIIIEETIDADNATKVEQLLKELRGHYGKLSEIIMELIDNASSAFEKFHINDGKITVSISKNFDGTIHVVVRDNGPGIQDINAALTIGDREHAITALNGHGMGFKNLPVIRVTLRTANQNGEAWVVKGPFVEGVKMNRVAGFDDLEHGTEFEFDVKGEFLYADIARWGERSSAAGDKYAFMTLCEYLAEHVGVVMGRRMNALGHSITIHAQDIKGKPRDIEVKPLTLNVDPVALVKNRPEIGLAQGSTMVNSFEEDSTSQIKVDFAFGYGAPSRPSKRGYFQWNQVSQGWYVYINGRYIGKTDAISCRETHPSLNGLMGWVDFTVDYAEQAPQTEIAKTGFVQASHQYNQLLAVIHNLIPNLNDILTAETKAANVHDIMRDELITHWLSMKHVCKKEVQVPGTSEMRMDAINYDTREMVELKSKAASAKDAYQVLGYVAAYLHNTPDNIPFSKVIIAANDFPDTFLGALADANAILSRDGIEIETRYLYEMEGIKTLPSAKKNR